MFACVAFSFIDCLSVFVLLDFKFTDGLSMFTFLAFGFADCLSMFMQLVFRIRHAILIDAIDVQLILSNDDLFSK